MSVRDLIVESLTLDGPGTINDLSLRTGLPLSTVRNHVYLNCSRDDIAGEWLDLYAWRFDSESARVFYLSGKEQL